MPKQRVIAHWTWANLANSSQNGAEIICYKTHQFRNKSRWSVKCDPSPIRVIWDIFGANALSWAYAITLTSLRACVLAFSLASFFSFSILSLFYSLLPIPLFLTLSISGPLPQPAHMRSGGWGCKLLADLSASLPWIKRNKNVPTRPYIPRCMDAAMLDASTAWRGIVSVLVQLLYLGH